MRRIPTAQCLLFDATPDDVIHTFEALGATREKKYGLVWLYPSETPPYELRLRLSVASWEDGLRLGLGSTITHEMIADMMLDDIRHWLESVSTAFHISTGEANRLITEKSNVIVNCDVFDRRGASVLRDCILTLLGSADGLVWSGASGWTSQSLRENPAIFQISMQLNAA